MQIIVKGMPDGKIQISGTPGLPPKIALKMLLAAMDFVTENAFREEEEPIVEVATAAQIPPHNGARRF